MRSPAVRAAFIVLIIAAAVALFVVGGDDSDDDNGDSTISTQTTTTGGKPAPVEPAPEAIVMNNGKVVGGVRTLTYDKGDEVWLRISLDEPQEEIHIHGYDIVKANPSGNVDLRFPAELDGVYELEAHGPSGDVPLAELRINP